MFKRNGRCDVDVRTGCGFLNYINGYVTKALERWRSMGRREREREREKEAGGEGTPWPEDRRGRREKGREGDNA